MPRKQWIGAIVDEYEKAFLELMQLLNTLTNQELTQIRDPTTTDKECESIASVINHITGSGNYYIVFFYALFDKKHKEYYSNTIPTTTPEAVQALQKHWQEDILTMYKDFSKYDWTLDVDKYWDKKVETRWGAIYDAEGILEHAIVHILRHRRQISHWIKKQKIST